MKRLILLTVLLIVAVTGCDRRDYGILSYQGKKIEAECIVNGEFKLLLTKNGDDSALVIKEPTEIEGIKLEMVQGELYAHIGDIKMKMDKSSLSGICAILNMLSLSEASMTSAKGQGKESIMCFENDYGTYRLVVGENTMPKSVKIYSESYAYDIVISSIKILE
ncbi:MAG: hypothetical protein J6B29_05250 [Clostridia bacterium]|nr:hypothetical protein [Clostridia bacterium]